MDDPAVMPDGRLPCYCVASIANQDQNPSRRSC